VMLDHSGHGIRERIALTPAAGHGWSALGQ
jgi:hypothetical protein